MSDFGKSNILLTRDSKGKIRQINISCNKSGSVYEISRKSGIVGGKFVDHPKIIIDKGKVKRTLEQQAELEYNSNIKSYLDKGYKLFDSIPDNIEDAIPKTKQDQQGVVKPMLAKLIQSVSKSALSRVTYWYISKKVDGVRNLFYWDGKQIQSASRGGGNYNYATTHIRTNPKFIEFFKQHPNIQIDGELFIFGKSLQNLSGCARLEDGPLPFKLQYYIYDIVDTEKTFEERYKILQEIQKELNLGFDPEKTFGDDELMVQMLPQIKIPNDEKIMWKLHDQYVSEGWEGAVLRDPNKKYNPGARDMIKLKSRLDSEFKTIGIELGLRGIEDMVFVMETADGKQFKAKPMGSREVKNDLYANFENQIKGRPATCTYFYLSDDGVPLQPVWKAVRLEKDI